MAANEDRPDADNVEATQKKACDNLEPNHAARMAPEELLKLAKAGGFEWVLDLCNRGIYFLPVNRTEKSPHIKEWQIHSSNDPEQILDWAQEWLGCRFAIDLDKSNIALLDPDLKIDKGTGEIKADGSETLAGWEAVNGPLGSSYVAPTPGGGQHHFFPCTDPTLKKRLTNGELGPALDYIGRGYAILYNPPGLADALARGLAPMPEAFADWVRGATATESHDAWEPSTLPDTDEVLRGVAEGQRDSTLFKLACRLRRVHNDDRDKVTATVLEAARACLPPFPDDQAIKCVDSAFKQDHTDLELPEWWNGTGHDLEAWFWDQRPELRTIHDMARARIVNPWGALGAVLANVCANTHVDSHLPAKLGAKGSLNLFVALVGPPGAGKGVANAVASEVVQIAPWMATRTDLGSGEGLVSVFVYKVKNKETGELETKRRADYARVDIAEVEKLLAIAKRQGATLDAYLRSAWSGESIGRATADPERNLTVDAHTYRLSMVVGVQPGRAGALLDGAGGGTPQRFIWMPVIDPTAARGHQEPTPIQWPATPDLIGFLPGWRDRHGAFDVPAWLVDEVLDERVAQARGQLERDELDAHRTLSRLKVAAMLALLNGRYSITREDWRLSEVVMAVSDRTRGEILKDLGAQGNREFAARGRRQAHQLVAAEDETEKLYRERTAKQVLRILGGESTWLASGKLRNRLTKANREYMDDVLHDLERLGQVEREEVEYQSQEGVRYRIRR